MSEKEKHNFAGKQLDVEWDGRLCIHIGECGFATGDLFVAGRQPWCMPDLVPREEVADVVARCPTGALTHRSKDGAIMESPDADNTVMVTYNGPYFVRGNLEIEGAPYDMPGVSCRAALCRCGHSKNKPFCDNSHEGVNFSDYGAIGDKGEGMAGSGGTLHIQPLADGPLLLTGNATLKAGSGRSAWSGENAALCRCGASNNKPFCDGSHKEAGFKSE